MQVDVAFLKNELQLNLKTPTKFQFAENDRHLLGQILEEILETTSERSDDPKALDSKELQKIIHHHVWTPLI